MIKSMTGFGKQSATIIHKNIVIEIRSLNNKQLDTSLKIPSLFREKENEIRTLVAQKLERGKIDLSIFVEKNAQPNISINKELFKNYYNQLKELSHCIDNENNTDIFKMAFYMPEVTTSTQEELPENFWEQFFTILNGALHNIDEYRTTEGAALKTDLISRIHLINGYLDKIPTFEEQRFEAVKHKVSESLEKLQLKDAIDKNRFEQELMYYLEKLDITEEKVRLRQHTTFFLETLENSTSSGKKLGFICQEMGREINTIGSKANHFQIQQIVVEMKDELEKIKEQILNIL